MVDRSTSSANQTPQGPPEHVPTYPNPVAAAASVSQAIADARRGSAFGVVGWLLLALLVIVIDQYTKDLVVQRFTLAERLPVIPGFFDLTLLYNPGAAFSFLGSASGWQRWFFTGLGIVASLFILVLLWRHRGQRLFSFALVMIMGGAIGNVIDRFRHGQVVDFLLFYHDSWYFPAFNAADSAITLGAILLILDEVLRMRGRR